MEHLLRAVFANCQAYVCHTCCCSYSVGSVLKLGSYPYFKVSSTCWCKVKGRNKGRSDFDQETIGQKPRL